MANVPLDGSRQSTPKTMNENKYANATDIGRDLDQPLSARRPIRLSQTAGIELNKASRDIEVWG
jgi:hypothetical protein